MPSAGLFSTNVRCGMKQIYLGSFGFQELNVPSILIINGRQIRACYSLLPQWMSISNNIMVGKDPLQWILVCKSSMWIACNLLEGSVHPFVLPTISITGATSQRLHIHSFACLWWVPLQFRPWPHGYWGKYYSQVRSAQGTDGLSNDPASGSRICMFQVRYLYIESMLVQEETYQLRT